MSPRRINATQAVLLLFAGISCSEAGSAGSDRGTGGTGGAAATAGASGSAGQGGTAGSAGGSGAAGSGSAGSGSAGSGVASASGTGGASGAAGSSADAAAEPPDDGGSQGDAAGNPNPDAAPSGLPGPTAANCPAGASYGMPLPPNPTVTLVTGEPQVAEGPLWLADQKALFFTEIEGPPRIYRYTPADKALTVWADRVGVNGLSLDPQGHIIAASPDMKRLTRFDITTKARTTVPGSDRFEGKNFNSVNDVIVRADGHMYFSDPGFMTNSTPQPLAYYHLTPDGQVTRLGTGPNPNSLGIPADGKYLYVTSSPGNPAQGRVWRHPLNPDGTAGERTELINQRSESLAIDCAGNLYLSFSGKILVYTAEGTKLGEFANISAGITNLTFGGEDGKTLYITARGGLYESQLLVPGLPN